MTNANDLYRAIVSSGRAGETRRIVYRCAKYRCNLLEVFDTPLGELLYQARYKFSEEVNLAYSNESGRAANTFDGNNHWKDGAFYVDQSALNLEHDPKASHAFSCDHVLNYGLTPAEFANDRDERHAEVRIRPDHSRYAV